MNKAIMMSAWVWLSANLLGAIMSGSYIGTIQQATMERLTVFTVRTIGFFPVPIPNTQFFNGLREIMTSSNYIFLQGNPLIIIVYLLNIGLTVGFLALFASIVFSFLRR